MEEQVANKHVVNKQHQFDRSEKGCMLPTALGFLGDIGHCFVGGPRVFPRVAATMISKRFVKLGIIVYF